MSAQSDILSAAEQQYIYEEVASLDVGDLNLFSSEVLGNQNNYLEQEHKFEPSLYPTPTNNVLSNEEYAGLYDFEVEIHPNGSKNAWVYSSMLNKVYMNMRSPFPVDFRVKERPDLLLYIRATPVYSAPQFAHECVYRCLNHEHATDMSMQQNYRHHIIKCSNKHAVYQGDKNRNEHLSVVIPFAYPQSGTNNVREMFEFLCKNSCPAPGMNRRAIEVIFTLEDDQGSVLGRRMLNVRVCSCPKRDKGKDEQEFSNDKGQLQSLPRGKKRKIDNDKKVPIVINTDIKEYSITLNLPGKENVQQVLKYVHDLMAGEILRRKNTGADQPFQKCIEEINNLMKAPLE